MEKSDLCYLALYLLPIILLVVSSIFLKRKVQRSPCDAKISLLYKKDGVAVSKGENVMLIEAEHKCKVIHSPKSGIVHFFVKEQEDVKRNEPLFKVI